MKCCGPAPFVGETHGGICLVRDHGFSGAVSKDNTKCERRCLTAAICFDAAGADILTTSLFEARAVLGYASAPNDLSAERSNRYKCNCVDKSEELHVEKYGDKTLENGTKDTARLNRGICG